MRTYLMHVPPSYDGVTPMPVVFDWHALLIDASTERGITGNLALSDEEGFIVVYPEGIDNAWNVGICCTSSRDVDDLGFARAMVERLKQDGCVDSKRIYATGYSMGGGMSFHLACNASDIFAAVAPGAFDLMVEEEWPCHPTRPIAEIQFRSTGDFVVRYGGGTHYPPNGLGVENNFLGAEGTFAKWAELDGCTGMPAVAANGCNTYTTCNAGVEVALCTKQGGGHDAPDSKVAWDFLKRFTLP
jgi:polyhydroxybutyrate depolymerase